MTNHADTNAAIQALPPLRDIITTHELRAEKSLGQNFLLDLNLTAKIVRLAGSLENRDVIEIGPGPGGLTRNILLQGARSLTALEKDRRAITALASLGEAAGERLTIAEQDALQTDPSTIGREGERLIIANLPYNIATPLLTAWLTRIYERGTDAFQGMVLMFQKEVADRIVATHTDKHFGRLSILCQFLCDVRRGMDIPPSAFTPAPKVHSTVVVFTPKKNIPVKPPLAVLEALTAAAFQQRRKMIRSSMKPYLAQIEALGIDPTLRAENISVEQYLQIAMLYAQGAPQTNYPTDHS